MPQGAGRLQPMSSQNGLSRRPVFFFLILPATALFLAACGKSGDAARHITWGGASVEVRREILNPSVSQLKEEGFPSLGAVIPRRLLELKDPTLKLLEFSGEVGSYAAFQRFANPDELASGFVTKEEKTFFRKSNWVGIHTAQSGEDGRAALLAKLSLPGGGDWGGLPRIYGSFLQQGRIPRTERVLLNRFNGVAVSKPVFAAQLDCHGDSAWLYVSPAQPRDLYEEFSRLTGYHLDSSQGSKTLTSDSGWGFPIRLEFYPFGMVGVEGCFDTSLTSRWLKTQKITLENLKIKE